MKRRRVRSVVSEVGVWCPECDPTDTYYEGLNKVANARRAAIRHAAKTGHSVNVTTTRVQIYKPSAAGRSA